MTRAEVLERKRDFVWGLIKPCLEAAKPHLTCCFMLGKEIELSREEKYWTKIMPEDEYVVVTCENGYRYFINVSGDSLCAIAEETFHAVVCK